MSNNKKCPKCDGRKMLLIREQPGVGTQFGQIKLVVCPKYNGTGEVDITNEEYMQTCSSDELANTIFRLIVHGTVIRPDREYIKKWLKEVHNG